MSTLDFFQQNQAELVAAEASRAARYNIDPEKLSASIRTKQKQEFPEQWSAAIANDLFPVCFVCC